MISRWAQEAIKWYVPFVEGHAIIYHGHHDADDHSECGPIVFCCPKAAQMLLHHYRNTIPATAEWELKTGKELVLWMGEDGPRVYYFYFCDPLDRTLLRFSGVTAPAVRDVLLKRRRLDRYLENADRIFPIIERPSDDY